MFLTITTRLFSHSKHRKSRVLATPNAEFSRSISVPADRVVGARTTGATPAAGSNGALGQPPDSE